MDETPHSENRHAGGTLVITQLAVSLLCVQKLFFKNTCMYPCILAHTHTYIHACMYTYICTYA